MRKLESGDGRATNGVFNGLPRARTPRGLGLEDLAALVTAAADGITVLDSDRRIVYANPAACKLLGYSLEQLVGLDGLTIVPESERQTILAVLANAARGQSQVVGGVAWRSDGSERDVELTTSTVDLRSKRYILVASRDVTERRRQGRHAAALAQAAASVVFSDSIEATVEAIAECALRGTRALAAWVNLDNQDRVGAWLGAAGVPDGFREQFGADACGRARYIFREALTAHRVVIYADARQKVERELEPACRAGPLMSLPWQAGIFVPLVYRGAIAGVLLAVYREGELPNEAEATFLTALADQAATAAANARLMATAREKFALEERQRLARELHDSVSQSLYGIQVAAGMARARLEQDPAAAGEPIDHVMELADAGQAEMRALIFELRADSLETEGLVTSLDTHIKAVRARSGIAGQTIVKDEPDAPVEVKQALYRIAQEALRNAVRHASAQRVDVRLDARPRAVVLEIADDGVGFDPDSSFPGHLGLRSMRERALEVGGSLELTSCKGRGTRIVVRVPSAPPNGLGDGGPLTLP